MMLCRERASVEEERVDEGNEQGRDATEHGRQEGKMGGRKRAEDGLSEEGREHLGSPWVLRSCSKVY